ncbi:MAG TPA: hypothetical protein VHO03_07335 [Ignavibacteriales bacterium]|nr:hypothetical protein [Ignavibacteriales bacterium]
MNPNDLPENGESFPRKLSPREKEWLFYLLPRDRPGYSAYRDKIENLFVIGHGNFSSTSYILGKYEDKADLAAPPVPVFAAGSIFYKETEVYAVIHEEFEGQIEIDISRTGSKVLPKELHELKRWTYSDWKPGKGAPGDSSALREIHIVPGRVVLVIAGEHKRIWVYEAQSGVNHFIPVTNFFNDLMRVRNIRDPKIVLNSSLIFDPSFELKDEELGQAFLLYNKNRKKISLDYSIFVSTEKKDKGHSLFRIFKRG